MLECFKVVTLECYYTDTNILNCLKDTTFQHCDFSTSYRPKTCYFFNKFARYFSDLIWKLIYPMPYLYY